MYPRMQAEHRRAFRRSIVDAVCGVEDGADRAIEVQVWEGSWTVRHRSGACVEGRHDLTFAQALADLRILSAELPSDFSRAMLTLPTYRHFWPITISRLSDSISLE